MSVRDRSAVVVEDDPDIRGLIVHSLTMQGFEVHPAPDGHTGIKLTQEHGPDLITIDLGLPDLEGFEVCRRIRATTDAYIVMLSARASEVDRLMGLETGADDYMVKPFSPRELQARVNAMFRRPRTSAKSGTTVTADAASTQPVMVGALAPSAAAPGSSEESAPAQPKAQAPAPGTTSWEDDHEVVSYGVLEVDIDGRLVRVDGDEVPLTRTEFDLMATMIRSPKRVWSRETLLREVWGEQWNMDSHLVEVHVGNLRRKLGGGTSRFIRTIRGVGYRIETPGEAASRR